MADWQAGDLALCVRDIGRGVVRGKMFTVSSAFITPANKCGLLFVEIAPWGRARGFWAGCFRKVTPPKPTADDREVIDLMLGKPARVGADA